MRFRRTRDASRGINPTTKAQSLCKNYSLFMRALTAYEHVAVGEEDEPFCKREFQRDGKSSSQEFIKSTNAMYKWGKGEVVLREKKKRPNTQSIQKMVVRGLRSMGGWRRPLYARAIKKANGNSDSDEYTLTHKCST